jgi:hypothetical protein
MVVKEFATFEQVVDKAKAFSGPSHWRLQRRG